MKPFPNSKFREKEEHCSKRIQLLENLLLNHMFHKLFIDDLKCFRRIRILFTTIFLHSYSSCDVLFQYSNFK